MRYDRIKLRLAGEQHEFLYNKHNAQVYLPAFPGIAVHKIVLRCGHTVGHDALSNIIQHKIQAHELALAQAELAAAIHNFHDHGLS